MVNRQVNRREKDKDRFKYRPSDPKKVKERASQQGGNFDSIYVPGVDSWVPAQGDNQIRILPPTWEDHEHYGLEIWTHGYVGNTKSTYLCPKEMRGKKCPICKAAQESKDAGEDDEFDKLKAKKRYLYYIIDREGKEQTPQVWSVSWTMDRDIAALAYNKKRGSILELDNPDAGYDILFKRTGAGLNTRYVGLQIEREKNEVDESPKKQKSILEFTVENPLDGLLKFYDTERLQAIMDGVGGDKDEDLDDEDEDDDDDEDDRKKKKRSSRDDDDDEDDAPKKKRKGRDRDDDDDEDEDDAPKKKKRRDDDDDDDDDEPKRKKRKKDDDDEDDPAEDDDDSDDDDDDGASKKKKKRSSRDDDDDEDEDEDDTPKKKKRRDDDDDDDDEIPSSRRAKRK